MSGQGAPRSGPTLSVRQLGLSCDMQKERLITILLLRKGIYVPPVFWPKSDILGMWQTDLKTESFAGCEATGAEMGVCGGAGVGQWRPGLVFITGDRRSEFFKFSIRCTPSSSSKAGLYKLAARFLQAWIRDVASCQVFQRCDSSTQ